MIELRIEEILHQKGITKSQFAELMGVKKQNVNALLQTKNIQKLEEIANVLEVKLTDLWVSNTQEEQINGFLEFKGIVYTIKSTNDLKEFEKLLSDCI